MSRRSQNPRPGHDAQRRREQDILDEAAARRARGEQVKALRGATDRRLRIYTKREAGLAWRADTSSRAIYSVGGLWVLFGIISVPLLIITVLAIRAPAADQPLFAVGFVIMGAVWAVALIALLRSAAATRARRRRQLPTPIPNSDHLSPFPDDAAKRHGQTRSPVQEPSPKENTT